jgi:hypothetical protein
MVNTQALLQLTLRQIQRLALSAISSAWLTICWLFHLAGMRDHSGIVFSLISVIVLFSDHSYVLGSVQVALGWHRLHLPGGCPHSGHQAFLNQGVCLQFGNSS